MDDIIKFSEDKKQVSITLTYEVSSSTAPAFASVYAPFNFALEGYPLVRDAVEKMLKHYRAELHNILSHSDAVITPDIIYNNTGQCFNIHTYEWLERYLCTSCKNPNDLSAQDKIMARRALILFGDRSDINTFRMTLNCLE